MNKYQKALDKLVHYLVPFHATSTKENAKMINNCLNTFKELVDKETPRKVTHQATIYSCCTCPNCLNVIDEFEEFHGQRVRVTFDYCIFCGQHLDWRDE